MDRNREVGRILRDDAKEARGGSTSNRRAVRVKPATWVNRRRTDDWTVYVGRPSKWGNLFPVSEHGRAALRLYLNWLRDDPAGQAIVAAARVELPGEVLSCWCGALCHAEVLARLANGEALEVIRLDILERVAETKDLFGGER